MEQLIIDEYARKSYERQSAGILPFAEICEQCGAVGSRRNNKCKGCGVDMPSVLGFCFGVPVYKVSDALYLETATRISMSNA